MRWISTLGLSAVVLWAAAAQAKPRPTGPQKKFSDANVAAAIKKGVKFLLDSQGADGSWPGRGGGHAYPYGPSAIATYALLESDLVKVSDPKMKKALGFLAKAQAPARAILAGGGKNRISDNFCHKTYSLGLRANAFLAAVKRKGIEYKPYLRADVIMLVRSTKDGSYGYDSYGAGLSSGDNSNSQYGVLGVWAGVQADLEVPRAYWYKILKHWLECQTGDGGWAYRGRAGGTATMCTAGLASLFLCYDNLLNDGFIKCDQGENVQAVLRPLNKGLDWMDRFYQGAGGQRGIGNNFYLLYGVERVGLASGYKYFGKSDWYRLGAEQLLGMQAGTGGWESGGYGAVVNTSYALLFLIRGRHGVLFNKLQFDGDWNNRPRDMASLTRVIGREFEESTLNWQIVNLKVRPEEWLDAPILYISASTEPKFTDKQIAAIRRYVNMGGTILSCTECNGTPFANGIKAAYKKMFPDYELKPVPGDHKFFTINYKLDSRTSSMTGLQMIHNGVRPLVLHTDRDLPRSWQLRLASTDKTAFTGPANIALYLTDGAVAEKALAARGARTWPEDWDFKPKQQVDVARLRYTTTDGKAGNFDPEPLAWERFSRMMADKYKVRINVSKPMPIAELADANADVAVLCGTDRLVAGDEEIKALTAFVAGGGLLYVEAVGGAWLDRNAAAFSESAENVARQVASNLPDTLVTRKTLRRLTLDSPVFARKGMTIEEVKYRKFSKPILGPSGTNRPQILGVLNTKNMPAILFSAQDVTGGLVGYACTEVHGYRPESAFELMRNIVMTRAHEPREPATQPATAPAEGEAEEK